MRAYKYFIVYEIWQSGSIIGKGTCESLLKGLIKSKKDIDSLEDMIMRDSRIPEGSNAVIVNYILMDDEVEYESEG